MAKQPEKLTWHPGSYSMSYILRNLNPPQIVLCDHSRCKPGDSGCGVPCLLYKGTDAPVAHGVRLAKGGKGGKFMVESGDQIQVPASYEGWFCVFDAKTRMDNNVPLYRSASALAKTRCDTFLVGGREKLHVMQKKNDYLSPKQVFPCDVLKMERVCKYGKKTYLECLDRKGRDILIPFECECFFYIITSKIKKTKVSVFQIKDVLKKIPCIVKIIAGQGLAKKDSSHGWMKLTHVSRDPLIVCSTVSIKKNSLLEIPKSSLLKFHIATMNIGWREYNGYKDALSLCQNEADKFMKSVKIRKAKDRRDPKGTVSVPEGWRAPKSAAPKSHLDRSVSAGPGSPPGPDIRKIQRVYPRRPPLEGAFQHPPIPEEPVSDDEWDYSYDSEEWDDIPDIAPERCMKSTSDADYLHPIIESPNPEGNSDYLTPVHEPVSQSKPRHVSIIKVSQPPKKDASNSAVVRNTEQKPVPVEGASGGQTAAESEESDDGHDYVNLQKWGLDSDSDSDGDFQDVRKLSIHSNSCDYEVPVQRNTLVEEFYFDDGHHRIYHLPKECPRVSVADSGFVDDFT
ncbi:uncharacterized protein [Haliotis cracherodii]|uniref:uncharacterized protein n=1 Tax=Haliotis cracherodii TaxID=6455 RepID=UPI0039E94E5C